MAIHYTPSTPVISDLTLHLDLPSLPKEEPTELRGTFFPPEWYPQSGVQLTWPHAHTDWADILKEVDDCYIHIAYEILAHGELLLIVTPEPARVRELLHQRLPSRLLPQVRYFESPTNDTWARDHAFLTLVTAEGPRLLDFRFNGWGNKFPSELDNQICRRLAGQTFSSDSGSTSPSEPFLLAESQPLRGTYESHLDFVFEGGAIESNGRGTLMTTSACLLSPNRNPQLTKQEIEQRLLRTLHAQRVLWLDHGYLAGDDTDSHIDTLARFCPNDTIAYVQCTDSSDEHYTVLRAMEEQLRSFTVDASFGDIIPSDDSETQPETTASYRLIPLPLPSPIYDPDDGHRLPATYANFLVLNHVVLMPTYGQPDNDELACRQLQKAFPKYDIVPVDCRVLIRQHGSLHCSTMQYPVGVLF
ncbi:MAG: agmatine deiminase family protein [Bacteroidaceae bacterium]|nr:agmatine deiminase family protein [Bacteroidaceae bacterium]